MVKKYIFIVLHNIVSDDDVSAIAFAETMVINYKSGLMI